MDQTRRDHALKEEESAQGQDLYRAPGGNELLRQAREQAEASGWLPDEVMSDWPTAETQQQIVNRRQELYDAMRALEASAARASGQADWHQTIASALRALQTALDRHVAQVEATDGLYAQVLGHAPRLAGEIASLREEHEHIETSCQSAVDLAAGGDVEPATLRRKIIGILGRLAIHRQRGSELLFDTYDVDIAAAN
jgi:hypothetical protein